MTQRGPSRPLLWLMGVSLALSCSGCAPLAARRILDAGYNGGGTPFPKTFEWTPFDSGFAVAIRDEPDVKLMVWVLEPQRVQLWREGAEEPPVPSKWASEDVERLKVWSGEKPAVWVRRSRTGAEDPPEPAGTILVLEHLTGRARTDYWFWPLAMAMADAGYRVILPDLRGQGDSTGPSLGYVLGDAADLAVVIDALDDRGLLAGRLGVFGHSYGAAVAAKLATADGRVATCVLSGAPMTMRSAIDRAAERHGLWRWMTQAQRKRTFELISREIGFPIETLDVRTFLKAPTVPVLLLHGHQDEWVPVCDALENYLARPERTRFVIYDDGKHLGYLVTRFEDVRAVCLKWFAVHLRGEGDANDMYGVQVR
ncbi:MAG: alpha/beta hydrolase family protein [Planctomycetota bacterium]